jgi:hypothetical protein
MLEVKTKGNLTKEEAGLLKQSLMSLRLAFVQAVEEPEQKKAQPQPAASPQTGENAAAGPTAAASNPQPEEEQRKKFSKKY